MHTGVLNSRLRAAGHQAGETVDEDSFALGTPLVRRFYHLKTDIAAQLRVRTAGASQRREEQRARGGPDNLPESR